MATCVGSMLMIVLETSGASHCLLVRPDHKTVFFGPTRRLPHGLVQIIRWSRDTVVRRCTTKLQFKIRVFCSAVDQWSRFYIGPRQSEQSIIEIKSGPLIIETTTQILYYNPIIHSCIGGSLLLSYFIRIIFFYLILNWVHAFRLRSHTNMWRKKGGSRHHA